MKTSSGHPVKHIDLVIRLLAAVHLPCEVAIIKCKGHMKGESRTKQGNKAADAAAKTAGGYVDPRAQMCLTSPEDDSSMPTPNHQDELRIMQNQVPMNSPHGSAKDAVRTLSAFTELQKGNQHSPPKPSP